MINLEKLDKIKDWLLAQREKAKFAWSVIVFLAGLLGYQVVSTQQSQNLVDSPPVQTCPHCGENL